jgi:putative transposase
MYLLFTFLMKFVLFFIVIVYCFSVLSKHTVPAILRTRTANPLGSGPIRDNWPIEECMPADDTRTLAGLTAEERALAMERYTILRAHLDHATPLSRLAEQHNITTQTLRRWLNAYRARGLIGLVNKPRADRGHRRLDPAVLELVRAAALQSPHASIAAIHRTVAEAAKQQNLPVPSYASVYGVVQDIEPVRNMVALDQMITSEGTAIEPARANTPNEQWIADHRTLDVHVADNTGRRVRPTLTVIMDEYSRAIVGYYLGCEPPSSQTTALALRHAILPKVALDWPMYGIPQSLAVDHTERNTDASLTQFCAYMGISLLSALPSTPLGRGKVEFVFKMLSDEWLSRCADDVLSEQRTTAQRHVCSRISCFDLEELTTELVQFFNWYHHTPHPAIGQFPIECWQQALPVPARLQKPEELDVLLLSALRRVYQDGIHLQGRQYFAAFLADYLAQTVIVRWHPDDLDSVRVYAEGRFVGVAPLWDAPRAADRAAELQDYRHQLHQRVQFEQADMLQIGDTDPQKSLQDLVLTEGIQQFHALCDHCRVNSSLVICFGPGGCGKTWAARAYCARRQDSSTRKPDINTTDVVYLQVSPHPSLRSHIITDRVTRSVSSATRLVILDNSEHLTQQDLNYLLEIWQQGGWGFVLLGELSLLEQAMGYPPLYQQITTCVLYPSLTDEETVNWVRTWYTRLTSGDQRHAHISEKLSTDVLVLIIKLTYGRIHYLTALLTALEDELNQHPARPLTRDQIRRTLNRIDSSSGSSRYTRHRRNSSASSDY